MSQLDPSAPGLATLSEVPGTELRQLLATFDSFREFVERYSPWLSDSCIFVETEAQLPVGAPVRLEIHLRDKPLLIRALGQVDWIRTETDSEEGPPGVALNISYLDTASARLIDSIFRLYAGQQSAPMGEEVTENWEMDVESLIDDAFFLGDAGAAGQVTAAEPPAEPPATPRLEPVSGATPASGTASLQPPAPPAEEPGAVVAESVLTVDEPETAREEADLFIEEPELSIEETSPEGTLEEPGLAVEEPELPIDMPEEILEEPELSVEEPELPIDMAEEILEEPELPVDMSEVDVDMSEVDVDEPEAPPEPEAPATVAFEVDAPTAPATPPPVEPAETLTPVQPREPAAPVEPERPAAIEDLAPTPERRGAQTKPMAPISPVPAPGPPSPDLEHAAAAPERRPAAPPPRPATPPPGTPGSTPASPPQAAAEGAFEDRLSAAFSETPPVAPDSDAASSFGFGLVEPAEETEPMRPPLQDEETVAAEPLAAAPAPAAARSPAMSSSEPSFLNRSILLVLALIVAAGLLFIYLRNRPHTVTTPPPVGEPVASLPATDPSAPSPEAGAAAPTTAPGEAASGAAPPAGEPGTESPGAVVPAAPAAESPAVAEPAGAAASPAEAPPAAAASPPSEPTASLPAAEDVERVVKTWAAAWSAQRPEDYIACYTPDYSPPNLSRRDWMLQRQARITAPASILVQTKDFAIEFLDATHARATFFQDYATDEKRLVTWKTMELERLPEGWRITSERSGR